VQLLGSENDQQLKDHLSTIAKYIEANSIFVYRTIAKQKPFLTVLYGSFGSREAAQSALDRLPPHLKAFKPYLRTVCVILHQSESHNFKALSPRRGSASGPVNHTSTKQKALPGSQEGLQISHPGYHLRPGRAAKSPSCLRATVVSMMSDVSSHNGVG
jgi:hypothetical protein